MEDGRTDGLMDVQGGYGMGRERLLRPTGCVMRGEWIGMEWNGMEWNGTRSRAECTGRRRGTAGRGLRGGARHGEWFFAARVVSREKVEIGCWWDNLRSGALRV